MVTLEHELQHSDGWNGAAKRRRLSNVDQERASSNWQPSTSKSWSPADSEASVATNYASPTNGQPTCLSNSASQSLQDRQSLGSSTQLSRHPSVTSVQRPAAVHWPALDPHANRDFYTPPGQRVVACSQQHAPQLHIDFSNPLPPSGMKRVRLESSSIATQIANGWYVPRQSNAIKLHAVWQPKQRLSCPQTNAAQGRVIPAALEEPCIAAKVAWYQPQRPVYEFSASEAGISLSSAPAYKARCLEQAALSQRQAVPRSPSTACRLLEQWSVALQLTTDTFRFSLHIFGRVSQKASGMNVPWHGAVLLLGCLWLATKHEECRISLPTATKMVALVGGRSVMSKADLNKAELAVLDFLGWQPLKGWDDLHFLKGQPRQRETSVAIDWRLLQSFSPPVAVGWQ